MNKKDTLQINELNQTNSIILSKPLVQILGLDAALVFSELLNQYNYIKSTGNGRCNDFVYTVARMKDELKLSTAKQSKAISILKNRGIIKCYNRPYPFNYRCVCFLPEGLKKLDEEVKEYVSKYEEKRNFYSSAYKDNNKSRFDNYCKFKDNHPDYCAEKSYKIYALNRYGRSYYEIGVGNYDSLVELMNKDKNTQHN